MVENTIFILAEGDHDSAFLYRILKASGFSSYKEKIKDYPSPLNDFLQQDILNITIPEVKIQQARTRFLPHYVLKQDNNLIFIYSIGGDTKGEIRTSLITALNAFNIEDEDGLALNASPNASISVLFFFDADDKGTQNRMNQLLDEIRPAFPSFDFSPPSDYAPSEFHQIEDMKIGAYIFKEKETDQGMLEDVMIPLMKQDNDDIFSAAETFLMINRTCLLFKDKLTFDESGDILKKVNNVKFSHKKSLIGTIGQLQKSGMSNAVCISQTDYLTDEKLLNNSTCAEIMELLKSVMN